jgi:serralysin
VNFVRFEEQASNLQSSLKTKNIYLNSVETLINQYKFRTRGGEFISPYLLLATPLLSACGGKSSGIASEEGNIIVGLPAGYSPPTSVYIQPTSADPNEFKLLAPYVEPYWVNALGNENYDQLYDRHQSFDNIVQYAFPAVIPDYYTGNDRTGWAAASPAMQATYLDTFRDLQKMFAVTFVETTEITAFNTIIVSQNQQSSDSAGYAYFPNDVYPIGSDIIISNKYDAPAFTGNTTNFDYELLLHELTHAFGLKHPFEVDGTSTQLLPTSEDNSAWTVTTYTQITSEYDGTYRDLDLMAFAGLFGVNPNHQASDNSYFFSSSSGVFILDGAGSDTISAEGQSIAVHIDLRAEMHSYLGVKSPNITSAFQLTISSGSEIEKAVGGSGNDYLIGNALNNVLIGGAGDDLIFGGEGSDVVHSGPGQDQIDLSELISKSDVLTFETIPADNGKDTVFSFEQGAVGDVLNLSLLIATPLQSVVFPTFTEIANVSNTILRLVENSLDTASELLTALSTGGIFSSLELSINSKAFALSANSQATGEDQHLFHVSNEDSGFVVNHLASFIGNNLDIDSWHDNNFI